MNNNIVLIQSHCNTEEKVNYLLDNINKLKEYNVDILLFSYIPLPINVTNQVDYYIYEKSNPILFDERRHHYWWENDFMRLETTVPDYGWTVYNQIIKSFNFIKNLNYDYIHIFCYDLIIDDVVKESLTAQKSSIFKHIKDEESDDVVCFETALVYAVLKNEEMNVLVNSFIKEEYIERFDLIAEKYFENKLVDNGLYYKTDKPVRDFFSEGKNIFNLSKGRKYQLFVDNNDLLKFRLISDNCVNCDIKVIINEKIIPINENYFIYNEVIDELRTFGCLVDNEFHNWLGYLNETRINKITVK